MLNCVSMNEDLVNFIEVEMKKRGWSQADLARATGLTTGGVSMLLNQTRKPSPDTLVTLASAFDVPPVMMFEIAGLLPKSKVKNWTNDDQLLFLYHQLPKEDKEEIEELIRFKIDRKRAGETKKPALRVLKEQ